MVSNSTEIELPKDFLLQHGFARVFSYKVTKEELKNEAGVIVYVWRYPRGSPSSSINDIDINLRER